MGLRDSKTGLLIKQEKLGQLIGVTSQAVSKWKRGSVPDAELIPLIAQFARHQH